MLVRGHSSTNIFAMNNNIKTTQRRLQEIERKLKIEPVPSFEEFKSKWEKMDSLSRSVFASEAESGDFDTFDHNWRKYMTAVRSYLLKMGVIDEHTKSYREIAKEVMFD